MTDLTKLKLFDDGLRAFEAIGGGPMGGVVMGGAFNRNPRLVIMPQIGGAAIRTFELGSTVGIEAQFYDEEGDLFSPLNDIAQIEVKDPRGTVKMNWENMDPRGIGKFIDEIPIALTDLRGTWQVRVRGQLQSTNYLMNAMRFNVEVVA